MYASEHVHEKKEVMRFAVFTHVPHIRTKNRYYAYAPYVREMNLWMKHVDEVEILAPFLENEELVGKEPYVHNLSAFTPVPSFSFISIKNTILSVFKIPVIFFRIVQTMRRADHLHLRCPGNVGLLASFCQIFFPHKPKTAKYAGNWDPKAHQPWSYNLQKWLLSNSFLTRNMQVLVYGDWLGQSKNIVPFFTASFSESDIDKTDLKKFQEPFLFIFVGNLVQGKHPIEAIKLINSLQVRSDNSKATKTSPNTFLEIYGEGPQRETLQNFINEKKLSTRVSLCGNYSLAKLKGVYQRAHFIILLSESEGWPKVVAEGMFFGCIPIATSVSCVPWMLGEGNRGVLVENYILDQRKTNEDIPIREIDHLNILLKDQENMKRMSESAKNWSQKYTIEALEKGIQRILRNSVRQN